MGKLHQMKEQADKIKQKLDNVTVNGIAQGVTVKANGNKKIISIGISDDLMTDKESLEDLILLATNRALEEAEKAHENEVKNAAMGFLPGIM